MPKKDVVDNDDDEPVAQYLRVVQILRCMAGFAKKPMEGVQIAIVTYAFDGEVEQPLLLKMRDAKFLAYHLMVALGYHGVELARDIIGAYPKLDGDWNDVEEEDETYED